MECKFKAFRSIVFLVLELIDTLWNVNKYYSQKYTKNTPELIDTLWNVNFNRVFNRCLVCLELIDTLWNVNLNSATAIVTPAAN